MHQREAILTAAECNHHSVAILDHVEFFERSADLTQNWRGNFEQFCFLLFYRGHWLVVEVSETKGFFFFFILLGELLGQRNL